MPSRFQLEGSSLDELNTRILAEHGPLAKVVAVKAVSIGGISGFFAQRRYEVQVDVPDGTARDAHSFDLPARAGIAKLLDDADTAEAISHFADLVPEVSTRSVDFDAIMADLTHTTAKAPAVLAAIERAQVLRQAPLAGPGDLVLLLGLDDDALAVGRQMAFDSDSGAGATGTGALSIAGTISADGYYRIVDRMSMMAARAAGVREGHSVFVALGIPRSGLDDDSAAALRYLTADQVWAVVDVGRKSADTARWVEAVQTIVHVDAIAIVGAETTDSPETADELGLQVGWFESGSVG